MKLSPRRHDGTFAFVSVPPGYALGGLDVVATVREDEGLTLVVPLAQAEARGLAVAFRAAWITLDAATPLDAVGITAAFSTALAAAGIGCNVIAGAHHDHLFVPVERADAAVAILDSAS